MISLSQLRVGEGYERDKEREKERDKEKERDEKKTYRGKPGHTSVAGYSALHMGEGRKIPEKRGVTYRRENADMHFDGRVKT